MNRKTKPIEGVIFDMDGLILDSEKVVQRSWQDVGVTMGYPHMGEEIYHTIGFNRDRRKVYFKQVYGEDFPYEEFREKVVSRFTQIEEEEGIGIKAGAGELMEFLNQRNILMALATSSSSDHAVGQLKRAGLYRYFDGFVFGNMVNRSKPNPEIYLRACAQIGVDPDKALALEDAPAGVESAWAAGLRVIMVPDLVQPDQETRKKTWYVEPSLHHVIDVIKSIDTER